MPTPIQPHSCDIFCNIVDNYGDIGVCWRLARQLAGEHGFRVRLYVDKLLAFQRICPEIDPQMPAQGVDGVEVQRWETDCPEHTPGDLVIEAFACHLPEPYIAAMAARSPPPVWINLDYLSAEAWVEGCHTLPSPHPSLPLTKYFFFPGFNEATGGLLRERDLDERRQAYLASPAQQSDFWRALGQSAPRADTLVVSLFAYANPALSDLLAAWAQGRESVCCLAPVTRTLTAIEAFARRPLRVGDVVQQGQLEIRVLPFVAQADYDKILWSSDLNLVRGEDSFVRAQWAAKPLLWHIYPQAEEAHLSKLKAFLERYCCTLPEAVAATLRTVFMAWNGGKGTHRVTPDLWAEFMVALPDLRKHAMNWASSLAKQEDLCSRLVGFYRSKL